MLVDHDVAHIYSIETKRINEGRSKFSTAKFNLRD